MPPKYTLRPGTDADFDFYKYLHHDLFKEHVTAIWGWDEAQQDKIAEEEFAESGISVIQVDGQDIGVVQIEEKQDEFRLSQLWISKDFQGREIGTAITEETIKQAETKGLPIRLHVLKTNYRARVLYERLGFILGDEAEHGGGFYMKKEPKSDVS